jgi:hypothetical protein
MYSFSYGVLVSDRVQVGGGLKSLQVFLGYPPSSGSRTSRVAPRRSVGLPVGCGETQVAARSHTFR